MINHHRMRGIFFLTWFEIFSIMYFFSLNKLQLMGLFASSFSNFYISEGMTV